MQHNSTIERNRNLHLALAVTGSALLTVAISLPWIAEPAFSQNVVVLDVDVKEVAKGYRASELTGADVENDAGETIGSIDDLIVDRERVLFAILEVGGFLGIGGFLVAIPYDSMEISEDGAKIVLAQGSKEELQQLPEFNYESE
ncbi:MAG: PRC-barrel domain-containing protein [Neoaquamicrobium sediminum]|uniref:PRC-barrel domain-containing protein n=1 Tax=Neoaquamicrobium sediminum TaxID=1849104 RepID=UPI00403515DB